MARPIRVFVSSFVVGILLHAPPACMVKRCLGASVGALPLSKFGEAPFIGRVKRENDVVFWDPCFDQALGDPFFGTIVLNPDFAVFNVDMEETTVNPLVPIPAHGHQLIMIADGVDNLLDLNLAIRGSIRAVFLQQVLNMVPIARHGIH